jgi:hypothetical protein
MSSLADLPEFVGFFSYSREDDEASRGMLSALRDGIQGELGGQLGRTKATFRLWQDQTAIAPGQLWESQIKTAIEQAVFFIPIVTPRAVTSHHCKFEFEAFLARERALGRDDLVFPLLYIRVPALEDEAQWRKDLVLSIIGERQYVDWRRFRLSDIHEPGVRTAIADFCEKIADALRRSPDSPEERRKQEIEAARLAEEKHKADEAAGLADEEKQRAEAPRLADEEKRRAEAARQAEEEKRRAETGRHGRIDAAGCEPIARPGGRARVPAEVVRNRYLAILLVPVWIATRTRVARHCDHGRRSALEGSAVLEKGPTEILPAVGVMTTSPTCLCRWPGSGTPRQLTGFRYRKEKSSERPTVCRRRIDSNSRSRP